MNDESNVSDGFSSGDMPIQKSPRARSSRSVKLLEQLIVRGLPPDATLAHVLGIPQRRLQDCRTGISRMPLRAQRRLAELIITHVPELRREALRLQLQCNAEQTFKAKETETHMVAPPSRFR